MRGMRPKAVVALACVLVALEVAGCGGIIPEQADRHQGGQLWQSKHIPACSVKEPNTGPESYEPQGLAYLDSSTYKTRNMPP